MLVSRLRAALERFNPALTPEAVTAAVDELTRDRSAKRIAPRPSKTISRRNEFDGGLILWRYGIYE